MVAGCRTPIKVDQQRAARAAAHAPTAPPSTRSDGGWFRDDVTVSTADAGDPDLRDGSSPSGVDPASVTEPERVTETTTCAAPCATGWATSRPRVTLASGSTAEAPSWSSTCPSTVELLDDAAVEVDASDGHSGLADDPSGDVTIDTDTVGRRSSSAPRSTTSATRPPSAARSA